MLNTAPFPSSRFRAKTSARISRANPFTIARPRPVPVDEGALPRANRSKMRTSSPGANPRPSSRTSRVTAFPVRRAASVTGRVSAVQQRVLDEVEDCLIGKRGVGANHRQIWFDFRPGWRAHPPEARRALQQRKECRQVQAIQDAP